MSVVISCDVPPFAVPAFSENTIEVGWFPHKLDFLLADIDGDGHISERDIQRCHNPADVKIRRGLMHTLWDPSFDDEDLTWVPQDTLEELDFWKADSFKIKHNDRELQWHENDFELELTLPPEYLELQIALTYLREQQRALTERYMSIKPIDDDVKELIETAYEVLSKQADYQALRRRVNYLDRTYVRL